MKGILLCTCAFIFCITTFAQVGIGTSNPRATLDITGNPSSATANDGLLPPRIRRSVLTTKTGYGADQTGVIIYVTEINGTTNTQTVNIDEPGYYFFTGTTWQKLASNITMGDVKQGMQTTDHSGWILLNGRAVNTLTVSQQAQAAMLGFTSSLPNASNSVLLQNGTALGTVSGSMNKTIARSDLPNQTLTGTTNDAGVHNHNLVRTTRRLVTSASFDTRINITYLEFGTPGTPLNNGANGLHNHTVTTTSMNGGVTQTQLNVTPQSLSVNSFIYLGM